MSKEIPVSKDQKNQTPVPSVWRRALSEIVEAFKEDDFRLMRRVVDARPVSEEGAKRIEKNIVDYGATLASLSESAWDTSVCQWMDGYWDVLVDLFTIEEGASDLVLVVRVSEDGKAYAYDVRTVHVP